MDSYRNHPYVRGRGGSAQRYTPASRQGPMMSQNASGLLGVYPNASSSISSNQHYANRGRSSGSRSGGQYSNMGQRGGANFNDMKSVPSNSSSFADLNMSHSNQMRHSNQMSRSNQMSHSASQNQPSNTSWPEDYCNYEDETSNSNEVSLLMDHYGLSKTDLQKLSELSERELNAENLARVLKALKKNKQGNNSRTDFDHFQTSSRNSGFRDDTRSSNRSLGYHDDHRISSRSIDFNDDSISHNRSPDFNDGNRDSGRSHGFSEGNRGGSSRSNDFSEGNRGSNRRLGDFNDGSSRFETNKHSRSLLGPPPENQLFEDDGFSPEKGFEMRPQTSSQREWKKRQHSPVGRTHDSMHSISRTENLHKACLDDIEIREPKGLGRRSNPNLGFSGDDLHSSARYNHDDNLRFSQKRPPPSKLNPIRNDLRSLRPDSLDLIDLRDDFRKPPPLMGRRNAASNSLLGDPPKRNSRPYNDYPSEFEKSLLGPGHVAALLGSVSPETAALQDQIQALKTLQFETLRLKHLEMKAKRERFERMERMQHEHGGMFMNSRRSPEYELGMPRVKVSEQEETRIWMIKKAKLTISKMQEDGGRVIYVRFESSRVRKEDLEHLTNRFGRVAQMQMIKKHENSQSMNQAFIELETSEAAVKMLEHYMRFIPYIRGCKILMDRSNYNTVKPGYKKFNNNNNTRLRRSVSPSRQPKRQRTTPNEISDSVKTRLNVSVSADRRTVTHEERKEEQAKKGDIRSRLGVRQNLVKRKAKGSRVKGDDKQAPPQKIQPKIVKTSDIRNLIISNNDDVKFEVMATKDKGKYYSVKLYCNLCTFYTS